MSASPALIALAQVTRRRFCSQVGLLLPKVCEDLRDHLVKQLDSARAVRDMQMARDALFEFDQLSRNWIEGVRGALQKSLQHSNAAQSVKSPLGGLELLATEAVEDQLLGSKLALAIHDGVSQAWSDLRQRLQFTESKTELPPNDVVRPETLARVMLEEWLHAGLSRDRWKWLAPVIHRSQSQKMVAAYEEANRFLVTNGVMPEIQIKHAVRKTPGGDSARGADVTSAHNTSPMPAGGKAGTEFAATAHLGNMGRSDGSHTEVWNKARNQAQELMGRLKRLLVARGGAPVGNSETTVRHQPSSGLQALLNDSQLRGFAQVGDEQELRHSGDMVHQVQQATELVRQRSIDLKQAAQTPNEKATIEVVALMFQSILAEDRIQASLRIWFARLQIPVVRVALAEPDFFSSLQHPARRLIDRMGSCALGFDSALTEISGQALEAEVRRVVQVIEQYPETGRRVFQLVFDEFEVFLATHLQAFGPAGKLVSVAQQVEQKETLSVQYTIELRKLLNDIPVRDEVRDFLFKVWTDVLAVSTVKLGAKHADMTSLKQTACDLLWAASAKPTRAERTKAIAQLPGLLARLRKGMAMLGLDYTTQETHIKVLSSTMADAFMSRTDSIPAAQIAEVTRNLSALENFLPQDGVGDLDLDQESIEMITGVDASNIEVITTGGTNAGEASRGWARELQLGAWFKLDHNDAVNQVQLAWRSERGQLCLFTTVHHRCFLIQTTRVAAYLQAGLLLPNEKETLTTRATRAALDKLEANPERLFQ